MRAFCVSLFLVIIAWAAWGIGAGGEGQAFAAEPNAGGRGVATGAAGRRPNILFVMADQQRFDALGVVNPAVRTPALDRLCKDGVRFDRAYVAQALCTPSRASVVTGLYPHAHKLQTNVYKIDNVLVDPQYNLGLIWPTLLRQAGYHTAYIGKWHLGEKDPGCFDEWHGYNSNLSHWLGKRQKSPYRSDLETDQAVDFLQRQHGGPFLLFVSYYPPHTPYDPPEKDAALYEKTELKPAEYWGAVTAIDRCVGRLLEKLDGLRLRDNTLVIFTADHGDHFGKRPGGSHKGVAYDEAARVPLILRYPGVCDGGKVRDELVSNVDLMPTILDAVGIAAPASLQGASLLGLLSGRAKDWRTLVCTENRESDSQQPGAHSRGIRTDRYKLILREHETKGAAGLNELYDHQSDPQERKNLFGPQQAGVIYGLLDQFTAWAKGTGDTLGLELAEKCRKDLQAKRYGDSSK